MTTTTRPRYEFHLADALEIADAIVSGRDHCGGVLADAVTAYRPASGEFYAVMVTLPSGAVMFARQHGPADPHVTLIVDKPARLGGLAPLTMHRAVMPLEVLARVVAEVWEADANATDDDTLWA
jgi:hypothetical protein